MKALCTNSDGVTLVELVIAIVVIGVGFAGILAVYLTTVRSSADPMLERQAIAIAESTLEEILAKAYNDPDAIDGESQRWLFDDVNDYNGLPDTVVRNQFGQAINGLASYSVAVTVSDATLGSPGVPARKIHVIVSHPALSGVSLVGYRTEY